VDKFSDAELQRLRCIPCEQLFPLFCDHFKEDRNFSPLKNSHTERWHVHAGEHDFEILITGPKFFDTRVGKGGCGGVDLTMHLFGLTFKRAIQMLHQLNVITKG
jgi:hypothetical protein